MKTENDETKIKKKKSLTVESEKKFMIYSFKDGRIIRQATTEEYCRYLAEVSKKSKDDKLSGEVKGDVYGSTGLIYMQEIGNKKIKTNSQGVKVEITYFDEAGRENSDETLELAKERALERGIKTVIIASIRGETAKKALEIFKDTEINLIMATCNACSGCDRFSKEVWQEVEKAGHKVIYTNEDAVPFPPEAVLAYRRICEGMKVCVQITMSAVDQGYIVPNTKIISIAGTGGKSYSKGWGADTAVVIESIGSTEFFSYPQTMKDLKLYGQKIREIICMPR